MLIRACAATLALIATAGLFAQRCAAADSVVYEFPALRGDVLQCQWFDENLNDRSERALVRQIDALYNRVALPPGEPVNVTQTASASTGTQLLGFTLGRTMLCSSTAAIRPAPAASTSP